MIIKRRSDERNMQNRVSVVTCTNRPSFMSRVFENYLRQQHPWSELIIVLNNNRMKINEWKNHAKNFRNIRVYQIDEDVSLGTCFNFAVNQARYYYIAKFDDDDYYAPQYLAEANQTFNNVNADIVGKSTRFIYFESFKTLGLYCPFPEFSYAKYIVGATMVIKRDVFKVLSFSDITIGEDSEFQTNCIARGFKIYSTGKYNYATIRNPAYDHTFRLDDLTYLSCCQQLYRIDDYKSLVNENNYIL